MKPKVSLLSGLLLSLTSLSIFAQAPDLRDSVILESKAIPPGGVIGITSDTSAYLYLRVWITNKDTIVKFGLSLEERSLSDGAYATLAWPRTAAGIVSPLTATLTVRGVNVNNYHGDSPDSFTIETDAAGLADVEPPNDIRKSFWELKFDTAYVDNFLGGVVEFDTVVNNFSILVKDLADNTVPMNFVKSHVFVGILDFVSDIEGENRPKFFTLSQNYPNPFNANTQITFALPKSGHTSLSVFNVLGQKIVTLVDGYQSAGTKIVNWDGRDERGVPVSSGIYFYQLRSGDFKATKKMLVLK